jgi:hypothetical protein
MLDALLNSSEFLGKWMREDDTHPFSEDFATRSLLWNYCYGCYPKTCLQLQKTNEAEKLGEFASMTAESRERALKPKRLCN